MRAGILALVLTASGCFGSWNGPDTPSPASGFSVEDAPSDAFAYAGFAGEVPPVEILSAHLEETPSNVIVKILLAAPPVFQSADSYYAAAFRKPGGAWTGVTAEPKKTYPTGATHQIDGKTLTFVIPYEAIADATKQLDFEFFARSEASLGGKQAWDETPRVPLRWSTARILETHVGPFSERTLVIEDPCCDVNYLGPRSPPPPPVSGDLRNVWIWQDMDGLWLEANVSGKPQGHEELELRYLGAKGTISYSYSASKAQKNGENWTIPSQNTSNYGVRLRIPWGALDDRSETAKLDLTVTIWSHSGSYADGADIRYRVNR